MRLCGSSAVKLPSSPAKEEDKALRLWEARFIYPVFMPASIDRTFPAHRAQQTHG